MRGIVIPKEIDYIFQKKKNNSLFSIFSQNFFLKKRKKKKGERIDHRFRISEFTDINSKGVLKPVL